VIEKTGKLLKTVLQCAQKKSRQIKMSSRRSMTRDIHESIRLLLGKNTKILLKVPVKLELKGKENRILVFTPHRLFIVTAKVPARVDHNFHYLDIKGL
jgi:hypothetical protein